MMADDGRTAAPQPFAHEIASYTDEELDQYLEECGRIVSVQDPENIPPEFVQRLRDIVKRSRRDVHSHAVDLDYVAARLQAVSTETELRNRSPSIATTEPLPSQEEQDLECLRQEMESYPALVEAGGRPPYPFHSLEDFFWNPHKYADHPQYRDIISFWRQQVSDKAERIAFCGCHLLRWRRFRRLQHIIRRRSLNCEWTLIKAADWDSWEEFLEHPASAEWSGKWDFHEYAANMKARLTRYRFSRPFQLDQNSDRQDRLTTWIEYLGYEYWFYDRAASYVKNFQRQHDRAWEKLANSNFLRPQDTYDAICNIDTAYQCANERQRAEKAVESATANVLSTERAIDKSYARGRVLRTRLLAEKSSLVAAKETLASIMARNAAITAFLQTIRQYRCEQDDADRYSLLLRWILQQIPLIESELAPNTSAKTSPKSNNGSARVKRARHEESNDADYAGTEIPRCNGHDSIDSKWPSKRLKTSSQGFAGHTVPDTSAALSSAQIVAKSMTHPVGVGDNSKDDPSPVRRPLRRSTRIAERIALIAIGSRGDRPSNVSR